MTSTLLKEDPCGNGCELCRADDQPFGVETFSADGVVVKQMVIPKSGTIVPQHSHPYDHLSMLAKGRVKAWAGTEYLGEHEAPHGFNIAAGVKHTFLSLEDDTILYCVHNLSRKGVIEHNDDHHIVKED